MIGREYRPLGQGLAATGFAGLYVGASPRTPSTASCSEAWRPHS